nr:syntaxin 17-like protein [Parasacculina yatsui]
MVTDGAYKIPLKRFELDVLPLFSQKLQEHRSSLVELCDAGDWRAVDAELKRCSASTSYLQHVISDLKRVRSRLSESDAAEFDAIFQPLHVQAVSKLEIINKYVLYVESLRAAAINTRSCTTVGSSRAENDYGRSSNEVRSRNRRISDGSCSPTRAESAGVSEDGYSRQLVELDGEQQLVRQRVGQLRQIEQLNADLHALNTIMTDMAQRTQQQGEIVDNLESYVAGAQENVTAGTRELAEASRLKTVVAPVAGAFVGGCIAGPIGAVAGAKTAAAAAVCGGFLGYIGGRVLNKMRAAYLKNSDSEPNLHESDRKLTSPKKSTSFHSFFKKKRNRASSWDASDPILSGVIDEAEETVAD